jgi:mono/diheme cytochrome c family protein
MRALSVFLCAAFLTAALAAPDPEPDPVKRGENLFHDTGGEKFPEYPSCSHCHALVPPKEEAKLKQVGPAATLFGSAVRKGWRNMKTYRDVGHALQYCAKTWQGRKGGFKSAPLADMVAFLDAAAPKKPLPARKIQKKPKMPKTLKGGDAARGKKLVERYCSRCHNDREDALNSVLKPKKKKRLSLARKVRGYDAKGKFKPQGNQMSYFTQDRLSDADLLHILAYLGK